jgi:ubiquinone biosynthesis protein
MEVQPSLVLLQKTLLNIEGLGRQLYPDLDLWDTAHPFLERWLKARFKPKAFIEKLKRHGPEWLEQLPQMPQLIFQGLENLQANTQKSVATPPSVLNRSVSVKKIIRDWIGPALIGVGLGLGLSNWSETANNIPENSLIFVMIGLMMLLLK